MDNFKFLFIIRYTSSTNYQQHLPVWATDLQKLLTV